MHSHTSINSLDEYLGELVGLHGFTYCEQGNTVTLWVPAALGTGYLRIVNVSGDIGIGTIDLCLNAPLVTYYESYANTCEATYCLAGHVAYAETGVPKASLGKNEVGVYAIPHSRGMMMIPSGERVFTVSVVSGLPFYRSLPYIGECERFEDPAVRDLLCRLALPVNADAKLHNHFSRIMDNDMTGPLQDTYLDSLGKVMLSDLWQQNIIVPLAGRERADIGAFEQSALMDARDILRRRCLSPPTTRELAKLVALNEYRLKTGFRQLFGKSVYDYAKAVRMENARHLLEDRSLSIGEIAAAVGYVNTSHFARAFRGEYGVNPRDFRFGS